MCGVGGARAFCYRFALPDRNFNVSDMENVHVFNQKLGRKGKGGGRGARGRTGVLLYIERMSALAFCY